MSGRNGWKRLAIGRKYLSKFTPITAISYPIPKREQGWGITCDMAIYQHLSAPTSLQDNFRLGEHPAAIFLKLLEVLSFAA